MSHYYCHISGTISPPIDFHAQKSNWIEKEETWIRISRSPRKGTSFIVLNGCKKEIDDDKNSNNATTRQKLKKYKEKQINELV